jgi:putative restriction endonuclease
MMIGRVHRASGLPSAEAYADALHAIEPRANKLQRAILRAQYAAPQRTATARELARAVGVRSHPVINAQYGRLGRVLSGALRYEPSQREIGTHRWWAVLSVGYSAGPHFLWEMHPQLADALERSGWVSASDAAFLPEELPASAALFREGAVHTITINAYERSSEARRKCLEHYGTACVVCSFDSATVYGPSATGIIHVHHLLPLSETEGEYQVDPVADLRPVCPNCHAVIHSRTPAYSIGEVQAMLNARATVA